MTKKLPVVKKGIKNFILDEDAKVIDSTFSKIAITTGFLAANFLINLEDGNAGLFRKHKDNYYHNNNLNAPANYGTDIHGGNNYRSAETSNISNKTVETMHANHYNHQNGKKQTGFATMLGVAAISIAAVATGGAALGLGGLAAGFGSVGVAVGATATAGTAIATGAIAVGVGGALGGVVIDSVGGGDLFTDIESGPIDAGTPYVIPENVLKALEYEEDE